MHSNVATYPFEPCCAVSASPQVHRIVSVPESGKLPSRWEFSPLENVVGIVHHTEVRLRCRVLFA